MQGNSSNPVQDAVASVRSISDAEQRAVAATELLADLLAANEAVKDLRQETLRSMKDTHTAIEMAELIGVSRARIYGILSGQS